MDGCDALLFQHAVHYPHILAECMPIFLPDMFRNASKVSDVILVVVLNNKNGSLLCLNFHFSIHLCMSRISYSVQDSI